MVQSAKNRKKSQKFSKKIRKIFAKFRNILPTFCRNFQTLRGPFSAVSRRLTKLTTIEAVPRRGLADGAKRRKSKKIVKLSQNFAKVRVDADNEGCKFCKIFSNIESSQTRAPAPSPKVKESTPTMKVANFANFSKFSNFESSQIRAPASQTRSARLDAENEGCKF